MNIVRPHRPSLSVGTQTVIAAMNADDQADILALLPAELRTGLIDALRPAEKEELEELLHYDAETGRYHVASIRSAVKHRCVRGDPRSTSVGRR